MQDYDLVVIGGGPAGLSAGLYATRARATTLLIEKAFPGGQAATTHWVENYPGFPDGISGPELTDRMAAQAKRLGLVMATSDVSAVEHTADGGVQVKTTDGLHRAKALIIASGSTPRELDVEGERALRGRGVSYCATCDGAFFRDKHVHVIGGGDSAVVEALFLTRFAAKVTIVHRREELRATKVVQEDAFANDKIDFVWNAEVTGIHGESRVQRLTVRRRTGEEEVIESDGVFVCIGNLPNTGFLAGTVPLDERGYVVTDSRMRTSARGVFAAGDCRQKSLRQIVTAVADGATAAVEAVEFLDHPVWDVTA